MDTISVRYGATFDFTVETEDLTSEVVTLYVATEGSPPVMIVPANFVNGLAVVSGSSEDTKVPLGTYKYQLTVTTSDGKIYKYPTEEDCDENGLPDFKVLEALDETEVVS